MLFYSFFSRASFRYTLCENEFSRTNVVDTELLTVQMHADNKVNQMRD